MKICIGSDYEIVNGRLYSTIYFSIENKIYPYCNWRDFVLTCLTCWYNSIRKCRKNQRTYLPFFDGNAYMILCKLPNDMANLSFINKSDNKEVHYKIILSDLLSNILQTCKNVITEAQNNGIISQDMLGIEQWLIRRKKYIK